MPAVVTLKMVKENLARAPGSTRRVKRSPVATVNPEMHHFSGPQDGGCFFLVKEEDTSISLSVDSIEG